MLSNRYIPCRICFDYEELHTSHGKQEGLTQRENEKEGTQFGGSLNRKRYLFKRRVTNNKNNIYKIKLGKFFSVDISVSTPLLLKRRRKKEEKDVHRC